MADRIIFRHDTKENWTRVNPILMQGEEGIEDDTKLRKLGDGVHNWNDLDYMATENVEDSLGNSQTVAISQKAVTNNVGFNDYEEFSDAKEYHIGDIVIKDGYLKEFTAEHPIGVWIGTDAKNISLKKIQDEKLTELSSRTLYTPSVSDYTDKSYEYDIVLQANHTYLVKHISGDRNNLYVDTDDAVSLENNVWVEFTPGKTGKPRTYVSIKNVIPSVTFADADGVIKEIGKLNKPVSECIEEINKNVSSVVSDIKEINPTVKKNESDILQLDASVKKISKSFYENTDVSTTYESGYINSSGAVAASSYAKHSGFVELQDNVEYYVDTVPSSSWFIGYYSEDNEGAFISSQSLGEASSDVVTIKLDKPSSAKYARVSLSNSSTSQFYSQHITSIDIPGTLSSLIEQTDTISDKTKNIESTLSDTVTEDVSTTYESGYINSSGAVAASSYAKHSGFVELQDNVEYYVDTVPSSSWFIGYYSEDNEGAFISSQSLGETSSDVVTIKLDKPSSAKYARVSFANRNTSKFYTKRKDYIKIKEELNNLKQQIDKAGTEEIYWVGANGDFTKIHDAFVALKDNENPKIIYIDGGEYDVYEEMGGADFVASIPEDVAATDWPLYSNYVPHNTKVIGLGQVYISFLPSDDIPQTKKGVICPMAFRGAVDLENISITAANCRYCVHDESGTDAKYKGITKRYKNVHLYNKGGGYEQAYGAGHQQNNSLYFDSCTFKGKYVPWSIHDNVSSNDNTTIIINSSAFISENDSNSIELKNLNGKSGYKNLTITNSVVKKLHIQDYDVLPNRYKVKLIRCDNVTVTSVTANGKDLVEIVE